MKAVLISLLILKGLMLVSCKVVETKTNVEAAAIVETKKTKLQREAPGMVESLNLDDIDNADPRLLLRRTVQYLDYEQVFSWSFAHIPDGEWTIWVKADDKWHFFDGGKFTQSNPLVLFLDYAMKGREMTLVPITNDHTGFSVSMDSPITSDPYKKCLHIPPRSGNYVLLTTDNKKGMVVLKLKLNNENGDNSVKSTKQGKQNNQSKKVTPFEKAISDFSGRFKPHGGPIEIITLKLHADDPPLLEVKNTGVDAFLQSGSYKGVFNDKVFTTTFEKYKYLLFSEGDSGFMVHRIDVKTKKEVRRVFYERQK